MESVPEFTPRRLSGRRWVIVLLAATLFGVLYSARNIVSSVSHGQPIDWWWKVACEFHYWYVWAAVTPLVLSFAGRFELDNANRRKVALALVAFGLFIAPAQAATENALAYGIEF